MNIHRLCVMSGLLLGLLCGLSAPAPIRAAGQSNSQYVIDRDVINAGGGLSQSSAYSNIGSIGQASPLGSSSNALHVIYAGFWHGKSFTLSIAKSGTGNGTVKDCVSAPGNCPGTRINCHDSDDKCSDFFAENNAVNLYPFDDPDSDFNGWFIDGASVAGPLYITRDLVVTAMFTKKPDIDADGLSDEWEWTIINADPNDGITAIGEVNPAHDFDGDGLTNSEEFWNETDPTAATEIIADIRPEATEVPLLERFRMDVQLRFRHDARPAHLVRRLVIVTDGNGTFGLPNTRIVYAGQVYQNSAFPGRMYAETDSSGHFAAAVRGLEGGRVAFQLEALTGGGGVILPPIRTLQAMNTAFLSATRQGRRLVFPSGETSVEIRIADLAATITGIPNIIEADWNLEGVGFQHVRISQQGYVLLGQQPSLLARPASWNDAPDGFLAPFFDELVMTPESRIYVNWDLEAEPCLTVQWCRMGLEQDSQASITFQIQLYQWSKQVRFVYTRMIQGTTDLYDGHTAMIGLKYSPTTVYAWTGGLPHDPGLAVIDSTASAVQIRLPDQDGDGLKDTEETVLGTDPLDWDSDDDLMSDGWEQTFRYAGLNPLVPDADSDPDGDGYINLIEYYLGSEPGNPASPQSIEADTDLDGMPDAWETQYGLNPNSAADAALDTDYDWYRNVLEYVIGGDPTDPTNHGHHPFEQHGGTTNAIYP